ncbi:MAG: ABC transporter substrate-binding protein [Motiliproteus sp.]
MVKYIPTLSGLSHIIRRILFAVFAAAACLSSTSTFSAPQVINVQLHWYHQFEYAGFYAAIERGFYAAEGLEVQLHPGGLGLSSIDRVVKGEAQYGVASSELLLAYLQGKPVVALAPIFQHSATVLLTRADSGIRDLSDMAGKRIEMGGLSTDAEANAMLQSQDLTADDFVLIPTTYNPQGLIEGNTDVVSAYITNQPYYMLRQGVQYRAIRPQAYGIDFYGDTLFTSSAVVKEKPQQAEAFMRATLQGWEYAFEHSDEIIELILKKYSTNPINHSRGHLEYERDQMLKLMMPEFVSIGHSNDMRWQAMVDTFVTLGLVEPGLDLSDFVYKAENGFDWGHIYIRFGAGVTLVLLILVSTLVHFNHRLQNEISLRGRAEEKHLDSEQRLSLALWGGNMGCWDLCGTILHLDARGADLLGVAEGAVDIDLSNDGVVADLFTCLLEDADDEEVKAERFIKRSSGDLWVLIRGKRLLQESREPRAYGTLSDVSSDHAYQEKLIKLSITDPLTGLLNRRYFFDRLLQCCSQSKRDGNLISLALLDIDYFKRVNDSYGHLAGDETLLQFASMLKQDCRPYDLVARYGGEEFIVLFFGMDKRQASNVLERYQRHLKTTQIVTENQRFYCTFSCGITDSSEIPRQILDCNEMVKLADHRLYYGKEHGRNRIVVTDAA